LLWDFGYANSCGHRSHRPDSKLDPRDRPYGAGLYAGDHVTHRDSVWSSPGISIFQAGSHRLAEGGANSGRWWTAPAEPGTAVGFRSWPGSGAPDRCRPDDQQLCAIAESRYRLQPP